MNNKFTTSAQKTLFLSPDIILKKMVVAMSEETGLKFEPTENVNIRMAKAGDGSKLIIASFDKGNGKALAMLDFKGVPGDKKRADIQGKLRKMLDELFR
jgi:hypothetical protein